MLMTFDALGKSSIEVALVGLRQGGQTALPH